MRRTRSVEFALDPEIERTLHQLRKENKQKEEIEDQNRTINPIAPGQLPNPPMAI